MHAPFTQFAELCQRLAETGSKLEKRALMAEYLRPLPVPEAGLAALYLAGVPFPETDGRELKVGGAALSRVLAQLSGASQAAMHAAYLRHGDLGGAAQDLLQGEQPRRRPFRFSKSLRPLPPSPVLQSQPPNSKSPWTCYKRATPLEAKYLIKIILGDMRTGIQVSLVEEAIAAAYSASIGEVRRARMLNGNLPEVLELAANGRLAEARMKLFHPLGFMLASPVETVEEALQRFTTEVAEEAKSDLSEVHPDEPVIKEAQLEDKYDGVRAQIHCGSPEHPGRVALFSRSREDMTASFPEIVEAFAGFDEPLVLDGEILAWSHGARPCAAIRLSAGTAGAQAGDRGDARGHSGSVYGFRSALRPRRTMDGQALAPTPAGAGRAGGARAAPNQGEQPPGQPRAADGAAL